MGPSQTTQHSDMKGLMMHDSLLVTRILDYAARWHPEQVHVCKTPHFLLWCLELFIYQTFAACAYVCEQEVLCHAVEGPIECSTWGDVHRRARQCSLALQRLGVR